MKGMALVAVKTLMAKLSDTALTKLFHPDELAHVIEASEALGALIDSLIPTIQAKGSLELMCDCECPIGKKRENYRYHLLLKSEDASAVQVLAARALASYKVPNGIYIEVDIDPLQML